MHTQAALDALGKARDEAPNNQNFFNYWALVAIVRALLAIASSIHNLRD